MPSWTAEESRVYGQLFSQADVEGLGVLTGDKAVTFFEKSGLPIDVLGLIWQKSDHENNGFLTEEGFKKACRLIGHAQSGKDVNASGLDEKAGQLASLGGNTATQQSKAAPAIPKVSLEDKTKFLRIFMQSGPVAGMLDGEKARDIFVKSALPFEQLSAIWNLADTKTRGSLDATEFILGMHLIQLAMSKSLPPSGLPASLPSHVYESALVASPSSGHNLSASVSSTNSMQPIPRQTTGILKPQSTGERPILRQNTGSKVSFAPSSPVVSSPARSGSMAFARPSQQAQEPWDITPAEKGRSDGFFDGLDARRAGYVEGDQAVPFFLESRLPDTILAQIWDLSDIRKEGRLNKDEFAVAMRLINDALDGKSLPAEGQLPRSLIPPSLRSAGGAFAQSQQQQQQVPQSGLTGAQQDLFSLMDDPEEDSPQPTQSVFPQQPQRTLSPQATGSSFTSNQTPEAVFGQAVNQPLPPSGATTPRPPSQQAQSPFGANGSDDFFGDEEPSKISNESIQIGQVQNEYNASTRGAATLTAQRKEMEATSNSITAELEELKEKLKQSKATYESEQKLVNELTYKAGEQKKELAKVRKEVIASESDLSALKDEKREWEGVTMRDKEEIRGLKSKLGSVTLEIGTLKTEVEKLKKDARQQKGLLAISKKQLSTAESDREKTQQELTELKTAPPPQIQEDRAVSPTPSNTSNTTGFGLAAVAGAVTGAVATMLGTDDQQDNTTQKALEVPLPKPTGSTPSVLSPAGSTKSTNPFERLMQPTGLSPQATGQASTRSISPQPAGQAQETNPASVFGAGPTDQQDDPFAVSSTGFNGSRDFDDAFGETSTGQAQSSAPDAAFDAAFDDDFGAQPTTNTQAQAPPADFDSAFDDFDKGSSVPKADEDSSLSTSTSASTLPAMSSAPVQGQDPETHFPAVEDFTPTTTSFAEPEQTRSESVPTYSESRFDAGQAPAIPMPSSFAPVSTSGRDVESSGSEDEGPEDLDRPSQLSSSRSLPRPQSDRQDDQLSPRSARHNNRSSLGSSVDDFEDAQQGLPGAFPGTASPPPISAPAATQRAPVDEFDQFDQDFVNLGDSTTSGKDSAALDTFDDDFAMDFSDDNDAFPEVKPSQSSSAPVAAAPAPSHSMFDDAFGAPPAPSQTQAPSLPARAPSLAPSSSVAGPPEPSPAMDDDVEAVKRLTLMGFSRSKAIDALQKYDYNVEKAANFLISS